MTRIFIIEKTNQQYRAVFTRLQAKQNGLCSKCSIRINHDDIIVSKTYSHKSKYFHKACAEKLNII
jgi:hypothetical protein